MNTKLLPVHVDGLLYTAIGFLTAFLAAMETDAAVKMMDPFTHFWLVTIAECLNGAALSLKMYRSTSYANSKTTPDAPESAAPVQAIESPKAP